MSHNELWELDPGIKHFPTMDLSAPKVLVNRFELILLSGTMSVISCCNNLKERKCVAVVHDNVYSLLFPSVENVMAVLQQCCCNTAC